MTQRWARTVQCANCAEDRRVSTVARVVDVPAHMQRRLGSPQIGSSTSSGRLEEGFFRTPLHGVESRLSGELLGGLDGQQLLVVEGSRCQFISMICDHTHLVSEHVSNTTTTTTTTTATTTTAAAAAAAAAGEMVWRARRVFWDNLTKRARVSPLIQAGQCPRMSGVGNTTHQNTLQHATTRNNTATHHHTAESQQRNNTTTRQQRKKNILEYRAAVLVTGSCLGTV